jgi:hypothetical protein
MRTTRAPIGYTTRRMLDDRAARKIESLIS